MHLAITTFASVVIVILAIVARVPTYRVAPVFLLPAIGCLHALRQRLALTPVTHALVISAFLLHMLGALGFYQTWPLPFSFDILVHFWFALVGTLAMHSALRANFPLKPWQVNVLTYMLMMGLAAMHEIMEYGSYLALGEEKGMLKPSTSYFFDTQRDLLNNLLGTLTALAALACFERWRSRSGK